jgi:hypothetical protein
VFSPSMESKVTRSERQVWKNWLKKQPPVFESPLQVEAKQRWLHAIDALTHCLHSFQPARTALEDSGLHEFG